LPLPPAGPLERRPDRKPGPPPLRLGPSRDWVIYVECKADGATLVATGLQVTAKALARDPKSGAPLVAAIRQMVTRRQAALRPGEAPYKPQIRFLVHSEGLRTYYLTYPLLEELQLPMKRQNIQPEKEKHEG
jgi:hypothetical protein